MKADISPDKAEKAGLLHDIAKEFSSEENARIIRESGLKAAEYEFQFHHILHALAGAVIAEKELNVTDPEILAGIRYHNGRPAMGTMDKIIYLADHIDYFYKNGQSGNFMSEAKTLDEAIYKLVLQQNLFYVRNGQQPDVVTECTMNYMLQQMDKPSEMPEMQGSRSFISDELFDAALAVNARQTVHLKSLRNFRSLGSYPAANGRKVRENCLLRSANLSAMKREDALVLESLGIDTIIDLRTPEEMQAHPGKNTDLFRSVSCPLPTVELNDYQKNVGAKFRVTDDSREKYFYLSEYLSYISMEDLYLSVLTEQKPAESLKKLFSVLLDEKVHGVLFCCHSGKDRTGIAAALILLALGVGLGDIRADYYASVLTGFASTEYMAQSLRRQHYSASLIDEARYYDGIGMNILENVYRKIMREYGGTDEYLTDVLEFTEEKRMKLRRKYLE